MSELFSEFRKPEIALCGIFTRRSIFAFRNVFNLDQSKLLLMQPWKRCIVVSFSDQQKEQSGHKIFLNLKSFSLNHNTLFKILYWKNYVGLYPQ